MNRRGAYGGFFLSERPTPWRTWPSMRPYSGQASAKRPPRRSVSTAGGLPPSPSATFRIMQKRSTARPAGGSAIDIVRRPTGGKAVLHDQELTYAVIAGADSPLFPPDILKTYPRDQRLYRERAWPKSASGRRWRRTEGRRRTGRSVPPAFPLPPATSSSSAGGKSAGPRR